MQVNKNKKSSFFPAQYGLWSANEYYYPNLFENCFTPREERATQDEMKVLLSEIQRHMHEFRVFMQAQLDENNPS